MSTADSAHFFRGDLPDDVPMATPLAIHAMTTGFDADRVEAMVIEPGDDQGYFVTALVFLNKARDEGYYFDGLADTNGHHISYPTAKDVIGALRGVADESLMELDIVLSGEGMKLSCEPGNFFEQLRAIDSYWIKNAESNPLDPTPIPDGSKCLGCPYYKNVPGKPDQGDGYCAYLDIGDWMVKLGFSLLWDGLKACQVKRD